MKKTVLFSLIGLTLTIAGYSQTDTISRNIYQSFGKLCIGTTEPFSHLTIVNDTDLIENNNFTSIADFRREYYGSTARFLIYGYPNTDKVYSHLRRSVMLYATGDANDIVLCAALPEGRIRFFTSNWTDPESEKMVIDSYGNVGIGTKQPTEKLQVTDGDIYISDIDKGIIMKSPDGNCWRGTLDNSGSLKFTQIDCPDENNMVSNKNNESTLNQSTLFPNPSNDEVIIKVDKTDNERLTYTLSDINGKIVRHGKFKGDNYKLNISSFNSGIYIVNIIDKDGNHVFSEKIIKN